MVLTNNNVPAQHSAARFSSISYGPSVALNLIHQKYSNHPTIQKIALYSVIGLLAVALFDLIRNGGILVANGAIAIGNAIWSSKKVEQLQPAQPDIELSVRSSSVTAPNEVRSASSSLRTSPVSKDRQEKAATKILRWYRKCVAIRTVQHAGRHQLCIQAAEKGKVEKPLFVGKAITKPARDELLHGLKNWTYPAWNEQTQIHRDNREMQSQLQAYVPMKTAIPITVKDPQGKIIAAAAVTERKDCIYVERFATSPENIADKKGVMKGVKGAGTAVMEDILFLCLRKNKPMKLTPIESAVPFYQKMGLRFIPGTTEMIFELKDVSTFLKSRGGAAHPIKSQ